MALINRPDYSVGVWASNGDIATPSSEKIEIGHIVEKPLKEVMNWIQNRQDSGIVYLMQQGISDWVSTETYPQNAYVKRSGVIYKSVSQNEDRDPLTYPDIWKQAFDTYGSAAAIQVEIDNIKTQEGYLDLYVSKANPVMTGRTEGVSYVAAEGVPTLTTNEYGFTFNNHLLTGLFLAGDDPVIIKDGEEVARFSPPLSNNEKTKRVVTMDVLSTLFDTNNAEHEEFREDIEALQMEGSNELNGYARLSNGLLLQWGRSSGSTGTIVFPIQYTVNVFFVNATCQHDVNIGEANAAMTKIKQIDKLFFTYTNGVESENNDVFNSANLEFTWFAIGI